MFKEKSTTWYPNEMKMSKGLEVFPSINSIQVNGKVAPCYHKLKLKVCTVPTKNCNCNKGTNAK